MAKANQNVGDDAANPVVRGTKIALVFNVTPLATGEVSSATYRFLDEDPEVPGADEIFTKTSGGGGITFADGATAGVDFTVVIDKADLAPLFAATYYHQLEITKSNADELVVSTGTFQLTAGAPALNT